MRALLTAPIRAYRYVLSPWLGSSCRFTPTCSAYAIESIESWGPARGSWLALRRISRCHPWCPGGHDPVPLRFPRADADAPPLPRSHTE